MQRPAAICSNEIVNLIGIRVDAAEAVLSELSGEGGDLVLISSWHPGSP